MLRNFWNQSQKLFLSHQNKCSYYSTKYLQRWQVPVNSFTYLNQAIQGAHSCRMISTILKDNLSILTDYQVSFAIWHIHQHDIVLDDYFYNEIVPIVKEYVKNFDRECNKSLANLVSHMGWLEVRDEKLWELFEKKLLEEKLWRYLDIEQVIDVTHAFATAGRINPQIFNSAESYIIKHRLALDQDLIAQAAEAFALANKGSGLLKKVLDNPLLDVNAENQENQKQIQ